MYSQPSANRHRPLPDGVDATRNAEFVRAQAMERRGSGFDSEVFRTPWTAWGGSVEKPVLGQCPDVRSASSGEASAIGNRQTVVEHPVPVPRLPVRYAPAAECASRRYLSATIRATTPRSQHSRHERRTCEPSRKTRPLPSHPGHVTMNLSCAGDRSLASMLRLSRSSAAGSCGDSTTATYLLGVSRGMILYDQSSLTRRHKPGVRAERAMAWPSRSAQWYAAGGWRPNCDACVRPP